MRFLHEIEKLNENKLRRKISNKIKRLERKSKKNNPHITTIGYQVGFEPVLNDVSWDEDVIEITYQINDFYDDFIPENTRIVYGMMLNPFTGKARHDGKYYYMDDQEYLYDFCKFIQDKEIEDSYDFFGYLKDFLGEYFGTIKDIDRNDMFSLLVDSNGNYIKPHQEHSIRDFKGKGNAMCTEYAVMAQNILRMFDFESYYIVGNLSFNDDQSESHAFNIVSFVDQDTGEYKDAVIDFINGIKIYDMDFNVIGDEPFIGFIDNLDQDFADRFFGGEEHLTFEEYSYCILGDSFFKLVNEDKSREYSVDNMVYANEDVNNNKIYTLKKSPML